MQKTLNISLLVLPALVLASCATAPKAVQQDSQVAAARNVTLEDLLVERVLAGGDEGAIILTQFIERIVNREVQSSALRLIERNAGVYASQFSRISGLTATNLKDKFKGLSESDAKVMIADIIAAMPSAAGGANAKIASELKANKEQLDQIRTNELEANKVKTSNAKEKLKNVLKRMKDLKKGKPDFARVALKTSINFPDKNSEAGFRLFWDTDTCVAEYDAQSTENVLKYGDKVVKTSDKVAKMYESRMHIDKDGNLVLEKPQAEFQCFDRLAAKDTVEYFVKDLGYPVATAQEREELSNIIQSVQKNCHSMSEAVGSNAARFAKEYGANIPANEVTCDI